MTRTAVPQQYQSQPQPPTEAQVNYLNALRDGKNLDSLSPEQRAWLADADFTKVSKGKCSDIISQLKELPWKPRESSDARFKEMYDIGVETGRYAIVKPLSGEEIAGLEAHSPGEDGAKGKLMFYSVKRDEERLAVWVDVWASDARYPIEAIPQRIEILKAIAADPDAGPRFGREIGRCYVCGRTLTDETSRALGIGPVCRGD